MNNPPWDRNIFEKHCGAIARFAEQYKLPVPTTKTQLVPGCSLEKELGVGHYGVVYRTEDPGIVFKITSDETEGYFVAEAIKLRETRKADPDGIVRYYAIRALPEKHKGRNVYVLWREEAVHIGLPAYRGAAGYDTRNMNEFQKLLMVFKNCAHEAKIIAQKIQKNAGDRYWDWVAKRTDEDVLEKMSDQYSEMDKEGYDPYGTKLSNQLTQKYKGSPDLRFSWLLECCHQVSMEMVNANMYATLVGGALGEYLDAGLLLADVHTMNVGEVEREGYTGTIFVITDPGHSVPLRQSVAQTTVEVLR